MASQLCNYNVQCAGGTVYDYDNSIQGYCNSDAPYCGTVYYAISSGAAEMFTSPGCGTYAGQTETWYAESPVQSEYPAPVETFLC